MLILTVINVLSANCGWFNYVPDDNEVKGVYPYSWVLLQLWVNALPLKHTDARNVDLLHLLCPMANDYKSNLHQNRSPGSQRKFNRSMCLNKHWSISHHFKKNKQWCIITVHEQLPNLYTMGFKNLPPELWGPFQLMPTILILWLQPSN